MLYYTFKAICKDNEKEVYEYMYNRSVDNTFNKPFMNIVVKDFIKKDLEKRNLQFENFKFTIKLEDYRTLKNRFENLIFINPEKKIYDIEMAKLRAKSNSGKETKKEEKPKKYNAKPRLPTSIYGSRNRSPLYPSKELK